MDVWLRRVAKWFRSRRAGGIYTVLAVGATLLFPANRPGRCGSRVPL